METTKTKHAVAIVFGYPPEFNAKIELAENTTTLVIGNGEVK